MKLSDIQKEKLIQFNEDEAMKQAVLSILFENTDLNEISLEVEKNDSNEIIGQITRAKMQAKKWLSNNIIKLNNFRRTPPKEAPPLTGL